MVWKVTVLAVVVLSHSAQGKPALPAEDHDKCGSVDFETCPAEKDGAQGERWVVCHFTSWSSTRKGSARFTPQDVDYSLCTHINYAFAVLDSHTLTITPSNMELDEKQHFYQQLTGLRSNGVTVMLSIGGWLDSGDGDKWARMIRSYESRRKFVTSVHELLNKYNFDGLDMGFSFPACPQGDRAAGKPTDKEKYNHLLRELKASFKGRFFLSVQTPSKKEDIDECYDMQDLTKIVDWVNLMTYEYYSRRSPEAGEKTGAQAPICGNPGTFGVYDTVKYYLDVVKCPAEKMVLGVPFFAGTYTLQPGSRAGFGEDTSGPGPAGPYLGMVGYLSYYEVCMFVNAGWNTGVSKTNGNYIWKGQEFVSAPSVSDMNRKSCLIKHFNLKGVNLWTMDYDDFSNMCGCGKYPLLKTLNYQLRGLDSDVKCY